MHRPNQAGQRAAFTLVELLVVIAIIGILVALLLPAVQAAREAARRTQCTNNLKQLMLSAMNFESSRKTLPAGVNVFQNPATGAPIRVPGDTTFTAVWGTWCVEILPYVENQVLRDRFDDTKRLDELPNRDLVLLELPEFLCPSDGLPANYDATQFGRSSYRANSGVAQGEHIWGRVQSVLSDAGKPINLATNTAGKSKRGPFTAVYEPSSLKRVSFRQVSDGTSQTLAMSEYHTLTATSSTNPTQWNYSAWGSWRAYPAMAAVFDCNYSGGTYLGAFGIADYDKCLLKGIADRACTHSFASKHSGGVMQSAYVDGHVATLSPDTDIFVLEALATISGGEQGAAADNCSGSGGPF